ncbi:MAG: 5-formyltetrahydrofolate cyclo-ligase [Microbacteriaceae bacterium]|nr:5-formyltetrahydrofolate cyclo-ligase [Microbacteriaceae bacterium]
MEEKNWAAVKKQLRDQVRTARHALTEQARDEAAAGLLTQLQQLVKMRGVKSLACYLPVRSEPDTLPFIAWAQQTGIRVLLPACRPDDMLDWIEPAENFATIPGAYGIPEPVGERFAPMEVSTVDLILTPAAAVDRTGTRLGWGGGFYDRTLGSSENCPPVFAIVYSNELADTLPRELHDIPVQGVVTPDNVTVF